MTIESIDRPKRRARRLRFRLSTLFVLILILCSGLAWFHWKTEVAREQRLAVQEIQRADGSVRYDYERNDELTYDPLGPVWLETFLGDHFFACVVEARIAGDVDLGIVRSLPRLDDLEIYRDRLTPAEAAHLQDLPGLHRLVIYVKDATDKGLLELKSHIEFRLLLLLGESDVTNQGIERLKDRMSDLTVSRTVPIVADD